MFSLKIPENTRLCSTEPTCFLISKLLLATLWMKVLHPPSRSRWTRSFLLNQPSKLQLKNGLCCWPLCKVGFKVFCILGLLRCIFNDFTALDTSSKIMEINWNIILVAIAITIYSQQCHWQWPHCKSLEHCKSSYPFVGKVTDHTTCRSQQKYLRFSLILFIRPTNHGQIWRIIIYYSS